MADHHADGGGTERTVPNHFDIFMGLRPVGDGPGHRYGIVRVDVLVHGNDQFSHAVAIFQQGIHGLPGILVVSLFHP